MASRPRVSKKAAAKGAAKRNAQKPSRKARAKVVKRPVKRALAKRKVAKTPDLPYFVHPKGMVDSEQVGKGTRVWAFAHVMKGAVVGESCNIGESVFVEAGARLGNHVTIKNGVQVWDKVTCEDYVFVGPNATFTNDLRPRVEFPLKAEEFAATLVERGASIGANATIVAGTKIGRSALIGAGTVVIRDIPAHALVVGNPARRIGWICACGQKLDGSLACHSCGRAYVQGQGGLSLIS